MFVAGDLVSTREKEFFLERAPGGACGFEFVNPTDALLVIGTYQTRRFWHACVLTHLGQVGWVPFQEIVLLSSAMIAHDVG